MAVPWTFFATALGRDGDGSGEKPVTIVQDW